ncbi:MAG: hypothetical protein ACTSXA_07800 [Candidatus Heimdallarchaeota archaeon]
MSLEERIFKQIQDLSTSIIRALDSLEKELSEYIEVTDKRLLKLEDKFQKVESYIDASSKGLVKSIESTAPEKTISLPQTHPREKAASQPAIQPPVTAPIEQSKVSLPITPLSADIKPEKPAAQVKEKPSIPSTSSIPPVPTPPSFKAVISEEKPAAQAPITTKQPVTSQPPIPKIPEVQQPKAETQQAPVAPQVEEGEKKEDDKDKKDLMSALKMIDSL